LQISILWIGSFLSKHRGSKGVSELLAEKLMFEGVQSELASTFENKFFRLLDIVFKTLLTKASIIHIDIYSGSAFQWAAISSFIAQARQKKIILTLHGGKLNEFERTHANQMKRLLKRANYILTPSTFLHNHFTQSGYKVNYLPNSIQLEKFPFNRSHVKPKSLLWVRGFTHIYNPIWTIEIFKGIKNIEPNATLTMIGPDRGLMQEAKNKAIELNVISSIQFLGPVQNDDLYKYYQTHEVFLNTTSYESFGVALIEAASCGIPIVSTKVGEIPLLWTEHVNIKLATIFETNEFVNQVLELFANPQMAATQSENALQRIQSFNWAHLKLEWLAILQKSFKSTQQHFND
jgi:L-malate glycosyltransferase